MNVTRKDASFCEKARKQREREIEDALQAVLVALREDPSTITVTSSGVQPKIFTVSTAKGQQVTFQASKQDRKRRIRLTCVTLECEIEGVEETTRKPSVRWKNDGVPMHSISRKIVDSVYELLELVPLRVGLRAAHDWLSALRAPYYYALQAAWPREQFD